MSDISYEIDNDGVAVVTWNLKDRSMNVLNFNSLGEYGEVIKKLILDENVKGIVLKNLVLILKIYVVLKRHLLQALILHLQKFLVLIKRRQIKLKLQKKFTMALWRCKIYLEAWKLLESLL